jgi:hypothetical protein
VGGKVQQEEEEGVLYQFVHFPFTCQSEFFPFPLNILFLKRFITLSLYGGHPFGKCITLSFSLCSIGNRDDDSSHDDEQMFALSSKVKTGTHLFPFFSCEKECFPPSHAHDFMLR